MSTVQRLLIFQAAFWELTRVPLVWLHLTLHKIRTRLAPVAKRRRHGRGARPCVVSLVGP